MRDNAHPSVLWYDGLISDRLALTKALGHFDYLLDFADHDRTDFDISSHMRPVMGVYCETLVALTHGLRTLRCLVEEEIPEHLTLFVPQVTQFLNVLSGSAEGRPIALLVESGQLVVRGLVGGGNASHSNNSAAPY